MKDGERWPPMVDALTVPAGLEAALGAALGRGADLGRRYRRRRATGGSCRRSIRPPRLPEGATRARAIWSQGPRPWPGRCRRSGWWRKRQARHRQALLAPGQALVSREGAVWRWDGYTIRAGTPTAAAVRLQQRNRLAELEASRAEAEQEAAQARIARDEAEIRGRRPPPPPNNKPGRHAARLSSRLERARAAFARLSAQAATIAARLSGLEEQVERIEAEHVEAETALAGARAAHAALPDIAALRAAVEQSRAALSAARGARDRPAHRAR